MYSASDAAGGELKARDPVRIGKSLGDWKAGSYQEVGVPPLFVDCIVVARLWDLRGGFPGIDRIKKPADPQRHLGARHFLLRDGEQNEGSRGDRARWTSHVIRKDRIYWSPGACTCPRYTAFVSLYKQPAFP